MIRRRSTLGASERIERLLKEISTEVPILIGNLWSYHIKRLVEYSLTKSEKCLGSPISPKINLEVTLRYLTTGDIFGFLQYLYRLPKDLVNAYRMFLLLLSWFSAHSCQFLQILSLVTPLKFSNALFNLFMCSFHFIFHKISYFWYMFKKEINWFSSHLFIVKNVDTWSQNACWPLYTWKVQNRIPRSSKLAGLSTLGKYLWESSKGTFL